MTTDDTSDPLGSLPPGSDPSGADPFVAGALCTLTPPHHGQAFWADLERRLAEEGDAPSIPALVLHPLVADTDTEAEADTEAELHPIAELTSVEATSRRHRGARSRTRSRLLFPVSAAAALLLIGGVAVANRTNDGHVVGVTAATGRTDPGTGAQTKDPVTTAARAAQPRHPGTTRRGATGGQAAIQDEPTSPGGAALEWIQSIADGDTHRTWMLMGPASQAHWGSEDELARAMPELASGYGAWARAQAVVTSTFTVSAGGLSSSGLPSSGGGELEVVVLEGVVSMEGSTQARTQAIPVRSVGRQTVTRRVEPFAFGPGETTPEFVRPATTPHGLGPISPDSPIELAGKGDQLTLILDDGPVHPIAIRSGRATFQPSMGLTLGTHRIVVASVGPDWFTAVAAPFVVNDTGPTTSA